jgi:hypothetical protein
LLDACRAGNAAVRYDALLTALIGAAAQDLAAAVSAHAITESQARAALEAKRTQIIALLVASHPLIKPPAAAGESSNS